MSPPDTPAWSPKDDIGSFYWAWEETYQPPHSASQVGSCFTYWGEGSDSIKEYVVQNLGAWGNSIFTEGSNFCFSQLPTFSDQPFPFSSL